MRSCLMGLCLRGTLFFLDFGVRGNNSVVECDLAKVEVAGSNPVSRSIFLSRPAILHRRRRGQVVRQRSAKPPSPVQIRAAPPFFPPEDHCLQKITDWSRIDPAHLSRRPHEMKRRRLVLVAKSSRREDNTWRSVPGSGHCPGSRCCNQDGSVTFMVSSGRRRQSGKQQSQR